MNTLYTFPAAFGLRNVSPFCLKVEMALTYLNIEFEIREMSDPRQAPKNKLPFMDFNGEIIPDSELIFEYLDRVSQGKLYAGLSAEQKAKGFAFARLAEDHLYWIMVASRWLDASWFPNVTRGFFGKMPIPMRWIVPSVALKQMKQTYKLQGLGAHTLDEQKNFARRDLQSISDAVGENSFLLGAELSAFDFTVAPQVIGILDNSPETWLTPIVREFDNLPVYVERVQQEIGVFARIAV